MMKNDEYSIQLLIFMEDLCLYVSVAISRFVVGTILCMLR